MTRDRALQLFVLCWLTVVYIWLWGNVSIANIASGLLIGALIMWSLRLPKVHVTGSVHPLAMMKLVGLSCYYALESSVAVAWLALRPGPLPTTGVVRIRLLIESDLVLVLCCDVLNLIPGSMVLEIDKEHRTVYVHLLDAGSPNAVGKFYRTTRRLEKLFIASFEGAK